MTGFSTPVHQLDVASFGGVTLLDEHVDVYLHLRFPNSVFDMNAVHVMTCVLEAVASNTVREIAEETKEAETPVVKEAAVEGGSAVRKRRREIGAEVAESSEKSETEPVRDEKLGECKPVVAPEPEGDYETDLSKAVRDGSFDVKAGKLDERDANGKSPLYYASFMGKIELVKALLAAGANPNNEQDDVLKTPLAAACANGHADVVEELLKAGRNPSSYRNSQPSRRR